MHQTFPRRMILKWGVIILCTSLFLILKAHAQVFVPYGTKWNPIQDTLGLIPASALLPETKEQIKKDEELNKKKEEEEFKNLKGISPYFIRNNQNWGQRLTFLRKVNHPNSTISGPYYGGLTFLDTVNYSLSSFIDPADFTDINFNRYANFYIDRFANGVGFTGALFKGSANFGGTKFIPEAVFLSTSFYKNANFKGTWFSDKAFFIRVRFFNDALFSSAIFPNETDFELDTFNGYTDFSYAKFGWLASFRKIALFKNARLNFQGASLPERMDFSDIPVIPHEINLLNANIYPSKDDNIIGDSLTGYASLIPVSLVGHKSINPNTMIYPVHYINLFGSDISKFHLDYIHFKLIIPSSISNPQLFIKTKPNALYERVCSMYEQLLANFKSHGQMESYKRLDIEYQTFQMKHSWDWWLVWLQKYWWNFGYNREWIFRNTLILLVIFTIITFFWIHIWNDLYRIKNIPQFPTLKATRTFRDFRSRIWYSLIYTSIIFFGFSLKVENINFRKWYAVYIMALYAIGLGCVFFIANYFLKFNIF